MHRNKARKSNARFLYGSILFFFVLTATVLIVSFFSFYKYWNPSTDISQSFQISFTPEFQGLKYDIYLNDSLLYVGHPINCDSIIKVQRFAEKNALLLVDAGTQKVTILQVGSPCKIQLGFDEKNGCYISGRQEW